MDFRIAEEEDENKQPNFNLAIISCEKQSDGISGGLECKVTQAVVWAQSVSQTQTIRIVRSISAPRHIR